MRNANKNNKSGGRPRLNDKVKKSQTLTARLTEYQYDWLLQQAEAYGVKPSTLLTECVRYTFESINSQKPSTPKFPDPDAVFGVSHDHQVSVWRKPLLTDEDKKALATCDGVLTECHRFLSAELKGLRHEDRLKHFKNDPEIMTSWIASIFNLYNLLYMRLKDCGWPTVHKIRKGVTKTEVINILSEYAKATKP